MVRFLFLASALYTAVSLLGNLWWCWRMHCRVASLENAERERLEAESKTFHRRRAPKVA